MSSEAHPSPPRAWRAARTRIGAGSSRRLPPDLVAIRAKREQDHAFCAVQPHQRREPARAARGVESAAPSPAIRAFSRWPISRLFDLFHCSVPILNFCPAAVSRRRAERAVPTLEAASNTVRRMGTGAIWITPPIRATPAYTAPRRPCARQRSAPPRPAVRASCARGPMLRR